MQHNNINTGLASKVDAFRWSGSMDNKNHVLGVKTTAPDFTIPPTPASSYQNLHVMLDHVNPSSFTVRSETINEPTQYRIAKPSAPIQETVNRSFSSLPILDNKLDDIPSSSMRLVLDRVDPDQPMARSQAALTSLKSEIAPLPRDELAERTDRELPASVDLSLFDETEGIASRSLSKDWVLQEEEERSWRMSREVDSKWRSNWNIVSGQLNGSSTFNLSSLENSERSWRMKRPVDSAWAENWKSVGEELTGSQLNLAIEDLSAFAAQLVLDVEKEVAKIIKNVESMGPALIELDRSLNRSAWARISSMEEEERVYRTTRGVDPVFYGNWHKVSLEFKSIVGVSWSEWFSTLKDRTINKTSSMADVAIASIESIVEKTQEVIVSAEESLLPEAAPEFSENKHLNLYAFTAEKVDFTFKSSRTPAYIIALEEAERVDRIKNYESNRSSYQALNKYLVENLPKSNVEKVESAFMGAVHKAESGISGLFGSLAHTFATTLHLAKVEAPLTQERKVDPLAAARKGRVNDELLHLTVKSV